MKTLWISFPLLLFVFLASCGSSEGEGEKAPPPEFLSKPLAPRDSIFHKAGLFHMILNADIGNIGIEGTDEYICGFNKELEVGQCQTIDWDETEIVVTGIKIESDDLLKDVPGRWLPVKISHRGKTLEGEAYVVDFQEVELGTTKMTHIPIGEDGNPIIPEKEQAFLLTLGFEGELEHGADDFPPKVGLKVTRGEIKMRVSKALFE